VPQGGLFWDGRADTLQDQAVFPLLNPLEMDGGSIEAVAAKLRAAPYAPRFVELFGSAVLDTPRLLVSEALFAVARYQIEEPSFHPYTSKFDFWLEGKARLSPAELRGYVLFNDPAKGNCGGCHLDRPSPDGLPPMFTDYQYEALGVPRNPALAANRDPAYYDLGICGPYRADMRSEAKYCGMFLTPTLRNTATRQVFFHNGIDHSLKQVLDFYDFRDTEPEKVYPRAADGSVTRFDDVPPEDRANIDVTDPPFDRKLGEKPPLSAAEEDDIIAFLKTLTDGYQPEARARGRHRAPNARWLSIHAFALAGLLPPQLQHRFENRRPDPVAFLVPFRAHLIARLRRHHRRMIDAMAFDQDDGGAPDVEVGNHPTNLAPTGPSVTGVP
jgi:cytochrome c peroxidase